MKRILLFLAAITLGTAYAQTTCQGTDPGITAGSTSCITFNYDGVAVEYTTVRAADGNIWLQQNLGSPVVATSATDATAFGGYFQWGRWQDGHEKSTSAMGTVVSPNNPTGVGAGNNTFIPSWWNIAGSGDAWDATTPAAVTETSGCDPCKAAMGNGWRVPTEAEWETMVDSEGITNIATGFSSNLKLAVAGYRSTSGSFSFTGARGYYWSSTPSTSTANYGKYFYYSNAIVNPNAGGPRAQAASVRCIKGISETPPPVPASLAITVQGNVPATIDTNDGTLQLLASVTPSTANQSVSWSITSGSEFATINGSGLVTAITNGTVTIQTTSTEAPSVLNTITVTISNQVVLPLSIEITSENAAAPQITTNAGTLQLIAVVLPAEADQNVVWSITSGGELATISTTGLVTAIANGTITIQAVSIVDATILDTLNITITGQYIAPISLELAVENNNIPFIITDGGTLQLVASILPAEANQEVTWSIISGSDFATIDANGLITAVADGIITAQAVSNDDATISNTLNITIINQNIAPAAPYCDAVADYDVEPISLVQFAGINNATSANVNTTPSYENFTSISGNVIKGETYTLTTEGNTVGLFSHDIRVFIDWNQDNAFDMASEYYATALENTTGTDGVQATLAISVPTTASVGTTRLRITKDQWNVYEEGEFDACTNAYYGQVEDYSLVVNEPVAGTDNINKIQFTLYPNPVTDVVIVQSDIEVISIEVHNLTGQRIATATERQICLGKTAAGIYVMKINFADGSTATQKIIRK